jgi:hypothetical protein
MTESKCIPSPDPAEMSLLTTDFFNGIGQAVGGLIKAAAINRTVAEAREA